MMEVKLPDFFQLLAEKFHMAVSEEMKIMTGACSVLRAGQYYHISATLIRGALKIQIKALHACSGAFLLNHPVDGPGRSRQSAGPCRIKQMNEGIIFFECSGKRHKP